MAYLLLTTPKHLPPTSTIQPRRPIQAGWGLDAGDPEAMQRVDQQTGPGPRHQGLQGHVRRRGRQRLSSKGCSNLGLNIETSN